MIFVLVNKRNWKTSGPIINMVVHNASSFSSIGYETHLCLGAGEPSDTDSDLKNFYGLEPRKNFKIHRIQRFQFGSSSYRFSVFVHAFKLIRSLSRKNKVVVITRDSGFLAPLAWLCRHSHISGYYELHDFYADLSWISKKSSKHYREKIYEHLFLSRISGLICITKAQQDLYRQVFPRVRSCSFPLGTKPVANSATMETVRKRRTLMYVGHMHGEKGVDFLLEVASELAKSSIRISFWGGKAKKIPSYQKKARELGVDDMVEFVSFQPPEVLHAAIREQASLGVVMLRDTYYNRYLTCPVKALDYLSHGIPAIGSDLPSVHEVLGESGTFVPPDDVDAFVSSVINLLDDAERYETMATRTRHRAQEITWENRARTIANFAKSISGNNFQ
jgi:glycosyltransferase involved in cell wall biosynthesis